MNKKCIAKQLNMTIDEIKNYLENKKQQNLDIRISFSIRNLRESKRANKSFSVWVSNLLFCYTWYDVWHYSKSLTTFIKLSKFSNCTLLESTTIYLFGFLVSCCCFFCCWSDMKRKTKWEILIKPLHESPPSFRRLWI